MRRPGSASAANPPDDLAVTPRGPRRRRLVRDQLRDGGFLKPDVSQSAAVLDLKHAHHRGRRSSHPTVRHEPGCLRGNVDTRQRHGECTTRQLDQLLQFVDRPMDSNGLAVRPQSLREVDNSFRHGFRVLFHRAVPNERHFREARCRRRGATHQVDLYLPRQGEEVRFATVACSPERTDVHIETIRMLALRVGQVAQCAVGRALYHPGSLVSAVSITLGGRNGGSSEYDAG